MATQCQARLVELKATGQLPSPTGVALAIMRLTQNEDVKVTELAQALESDPAMVGRLLKLANSAGSGSGRSVTTVQEAVTRLGLRAVRNLALGFSLIRRSGNASCSQFDYQRFWSRSLAKAVATQVLGIRQAQVRTGEAFTCGLLCDVGTLALASVYPTGYASVLARASATGKPIAAIEHEQFAIDHQELTIALLEDWGLPQYFGEAVRDHKCPEAEIRADDSVGLRLSRLLYAADHLAELCLADDCERNWLMTELFKRCRLLAIPPDEVITLGDRAIGQWQEWGKIFEVATCTVPSLADLSQRCQVLAQGESVQVRLDSGTARRSLTILAASADVCLLRMLTDCLGAAGHQVLTAANGQQALRLLVECDAQVVITDWEMDPLDGPALCRILRETKIGRQMYIILLADALGDQYEPEVAADDYLTKPVQHAQLLARIRAAERIIEVQQEAIQDKEELGRYAADLSASNRTLQEAAYADPLTGLPNRRHILERLREEWASATRKEHSLACMVVDIDHFKTVNDSHGHDVGDLVLQEIAAILRSSVRGHDFVGRLGGEEFVILCPKIDRKGAWQCAERLRRNVEVRVAATPSGPCRVTISVGVALREAETSNSDELLKAADRAVYAAKRAGRNLVCMADCQLAQQIDG
jgi:two-component system cell cycle response regulator